MNWLDELSGKVAGMTAGEWHSSDDDDLFRSAQEENGKDIVASSCDQTLSMGDSNIIGIVALRNNADRLLAVARAAEAAAKFDVSQLCDRHKGLRSPLCGECQMAARIEELRAAMEGK